MKYFCAEGWTGGVRLKLLEEIGVLARILPDEEVIKSGYTKFLLTANQDCIPTEMQPYGREGP